MKWVWGILTLGALGLAFTSSWKYVFPAVMGIRRRGDAGISLEQLVEKEFRETVFKAVRDPWVVWSSNTAGLLLLLFVLSIVIG